MWKSRLRDIVMLLGAAAIAAFAARYGIKLPEPVPPIQPVPTPTPKPDDPVPPKKPTDATPDPHKAVCKIRTSVGGCSATVIGPKRADGRYLVLTASHCIRRTGEHVTMVFRDGRTAGAVVLSFDRKADWCWMITESNTDTYPYAILAESMPDNGVAIWHCGFGVDKPGNTEVGTVIGFDNTRNQTMMNLSVSSGDSGGGIFRKDDGTLISCVCCTYSSRDGGWTQGASIAAIREGIPEKVLGEEWNPVALPHNELRESDAKP